MSNCLKNFRTLLHWLFLSHVKRSQKEQHAQRPEGEPPAKPSNQAAVGRHGLACYPAAIVVDDTLQLADGLRHYGFAPQVYIQFHADAGAEVVHIERANGHPFAVASGHFAVKHLAMVFIDLDAMT